MRNARFKPFWLTAEATGGKDCGIKASSRNGSAQTFGKTIVFLQADTFPKLSDPPKLELLIASRRVLLYEVSRWRKERTMINISLRLPA
jgi:hypothetical protein